MPLYLIERTWAEQLELTKEGIDLARAINDDEGIQWLFSFLSADKKKSYCLYEAPNPEAIMEATRRAGLPTGIIIPVDEVRPESFV
jgi:hypothetical protein